jgi:hypothetical protein
MNNLRFAVVATLILNLSATTKEKKIKHSDLPAAVKKSVGMQIHGAKIRCFIRFTEKRAFYDFLDRSWQGGAGFSVMGGIFRAWMVGIIWLTIWSVMIVGRLGSQKALRSW